MRKNLDDIASCSRKYFFQLSGGILFLVIVVVGIFFHSRNIQKESIYTYIPLGDSYTIGDGVSENERWPNQLVERLSKDNIYLRILVHPSVTGYNTLDLLDQELPLLQTFQPDIISLQIGVNDFFRGLSASVFRERFTQVLEEIQKLSPNSKIIIADIPDYGKTPYGKTTGNPTEIYSGIREYNNIIREVAGKYSIPVVDIFTSSLLVESDTSLIASDALHPSGKQYSLWVDEIFPVVDSILKK